MRYSYHEAAATQTLASMNAHTDVKTHILRNKYMRRIAGTVPSAHAHLEERPEILGHLGGEEVAADTDQGIDGVKGVQQDGSPRGKGRRATAIGAVVCSCVTNTSVASSSGKYV